MQEEANQKTVGIVVEGGKFTGRMFLRACDKYTQHRRDKKHMRQTDPTKYKVNQPKQITVKQFMKEGEPVRKVELQTPEIKEFEKLARKNGLRFAVMKDKTSEKPQYVIYFKARSGEARDAIVSKEAGQSERLMFGAYVLFPYPYEEDEYKQHQFYKSIDSVNIGGIPFLPGKTELAEDLLAKLVGESDISAFERTILPKGIEERLAKVDWNRRDVLVGSLRSKEQWNACYAERYYYVPVKNMPVNSRQANYIAIYQSKTLYGAEAGILYYGEVLRTEIVPRKDINNLPSHSAPNEEYYKFVIKEWNKLPSRISYEAEWVYKPRYTNLFLLQNCMRTYELFNIKSEADYRLVSELRRIRSNIVAVQDNPKDLFVKVNDSISVYNDEGYIYVYADGTEVAKKNTAAFIKYPGLVFEEIQRVIDSKLNFE